MTAATTGIDTVTLRAASAGDSARLIEILNDPPPPELLVIVGTIGMALTVERMLFHAGIGATIERTTVAEIGENVVGFMDGGPGNAAIDPGPLTIARLLVPLTLRTGPAAVLRGMRWVRINQRVQFVRDPNAYHVSELDVAATYRGRGIGRQLLERAEQDARNAGYPRMTLSTKITNPARRLYERFGFGVAAEKLDAEWERWALSPGRIWMVKELR